MNYIIDYFINKFESIPDENWCTSTVKNEQGQMCVLGHCGILNNVYPAKDVILLIDLLSNKDSTLDVTRINDGDHEKYQQLTPKARILAVLKDIKENNYDQI